MLIQFTSPVTFVAETTKDVDVSAMIVDATKSVMNLFDATGNLLTYQLQAVSAAIVRITSEEPLTGTFTLVVQGPGVVAPPTPTPASSSYSKPSVKRFWTYKQARDKIQVDVDIQDETFITPNELIGYFNEGIEEAESNILKLDEDYFLTSLPIAVVAGVSAYDYPSNIYAYKERGIIYRSGSIIYDVKKFRRRNKFENIAYSDQYADNDYIRWFHSNDSAGAAKINFVPPPKDTAIVPPAASTFTPFTIWYIRHANRIPLLGEYVFNWDVIDQSTTVDVLLDRVATTATYVTGDKIVMSATGSMPGGLVQDVEYFVIKNLGYIQFATTIQNALAGAFIDLTSVGTGALIVSIAASQSIVDNTIIDLPEFTKFVIQWAKCRCLEKEGDPRLAGATATLEQQQVQMVSTLTELQQDDQNEVEADYSAYYEMS